MQHSATHPSASEDAMNYVPTVAREQSWAAFLLAWVAAFSDAIGFLVLQQFRASFMSGNSMAAGAALGAECPGLPPVRSRHPHCRRRGPTLREPA